MHISIYRDRINNQIHRPCSTAGGYLSLAIDTCIGECNITFIIDAEIDIGLSLQLRHFMFMYYKKCVCVLYVVYVPIEEFCSPWSELQGSPCSITYKKDREALPPGFLKNLRVPWNSFN